MSPTEVTPLFSVAIVGRPNVGKSALFNRIAGRDIALVYDQPGVTRDTLVTTCQWKQVSFNLIDTGGIGSSHQTPIDQAVRAEAILAVSSAQHILFVVDGRSGVTPLDQEIAQWFHKHLSNCRITLVVNKIDSEKQHSLIDDFHSLGFEDIHPVSATHSRGIRVLRDKLVSPYLSHPVMPPATAISPVRIAILGKPNVGKSSLINAILQRPRTITSPIAGTTRDNIDIPFTWGGNNYLLIDTAGLRPETKIFDPFESLISSRSVHAINRSQMCIFVVDAESGITQQDKKIAGLIQKAHRPCLIAVNKCDIIQRQHNHSLKEQHSWQEAIRRELFFLDYAPILFVSAQEKIGLKAMMKALNTIQKNIPKAIPTSLLNRIIEQAVKRHTAPSKKGTKFLKIYFASPISNPHSERILSAPVIQCFVNHQSLFTLSYQRYLEAAIRKAWPLEGIPIKWLVRSHTHPHEHLL
jgi:GTP-binding protein